MKILKKKIFGYLNCVELKTLLGGSASVLEGERSKLN